MQVAEARIGRLSSSQREFITLQSEKNSLVERKRKRSNEEDALLRRVQIKLKNRRRDMIDYDDRLIIKPKSSAKSGAQRVAKTRASQGKKSDSTGAERQARRRSGWSRQRVEKEMEEDRVRKVSKRAGGLSQASKEDVRAGQRKNKDTEVFSGDALKTKEITEGNFIVEPPTALDVNQNSEGRQLIEISDDENEEAPVEFSGRRWSSTLCQQCGTYVRCNI